MCRVSQLKLSCGTSPSDPHYRRADELADFVRLTGTHIMPCLPRYLGDKYSCKELDIDSELPEGRLRGSACTYCSIVQPAWNNALADVLAKMEIIFDEIWTELRDDFRDSERQDHDEPRTMQKKVNQICSGALQAIVMWRKEQPWVDSDDDSTTFGGDSLPPLSVGSLDDSDEDDDLAEPGHPELSDRHLPRSRGVKSERSNGAERSSSNGDPEATNSANRCSPRQSAHLLRQLRTSPPRSSHITQRRNPVATLTKSPSVTSPETSRSPKVTPFKRHIDLPKSSRNQRLTRHLVKGFSKTLAPWEEPDHRYDRFAKLGYELILRERERRHKKLDVRTNRLFQNEGVLGIR